MKRWLIVLVILLFLLSVGCVYATFNTVWVTPWIIRRVISQSLPQFKVDSIKITKQKFHFPGQIHFQDVRIILKDKKDLFTLQLQDFRCDGLDSLLVAKSKLSLEMKGAKVESRSITMKDLEGNAHLFLARHKISSFFGAVKSKENRFQNYEIKNVFSNLEGDDQKISFKNLSAQVYGAQVEGEILLEYQPALFYSIQLEFVGLDINQLKVLNETLATQVEGILEGTLTLKGEGNNLDTVELATHIVEGGKIRASLLSFITQYIPQSQQRQHLQELLKDDAKVFVQEASVQIKTLNKNRLSGLMKISSEELNVDLNFPITINLDGKISSLFKYFDQFSFQ